MRSGDADSTVVLTKGRAGARKAFPTSIWGRLTLAALTFGVALRLVQYLSDRSLWLDESYLAINLMTRSYGELVSTLDYNQGAPIGFLWTERLAVDLFGDSERSLRLFPLVIGLASLVLFYRVACNLLHQPELLIAVTLFATMQPFVRYSAEVKQYGLDIAVTLGLVYLFIRVVEPGDLSLRHTLVVALAGPVAVGFSHPSVFVLAGVAAGGLYASLRRRDTSALLRQALAYGVWLLSFLAAYLVTVRDLHDLQQTVRGVGAGAGGIKNLYTILNEPGGFPRTVVGLAIAVSLVGAIYLSRRRPAVVILFATTALALLIAGRLGIYPVGQRFLLFLLPFAVLCLAEGVARIAQHATKPVAVGMLVAVAALIFTPVLGTAVKHLVAPPKIEQVEPLLEEVASNWREGDLLYLSAASQYAFRYYVECKECSPIGRVASRLWPSEPTAGGQAQATPAIVSNSASLVVGLPREHDLERLPKRRRVWLLYTHFFPKTETELLDAWDSVGTRLRCDHGGASLLCLYDFSRRPVAAAPSSHGG